MSNPYQVNLTPPDHLWNDVYEDGSLLILVGTVHILGQPLQIEAHAVKWDDGLECNDGEHSDFEKLNAAIGVEDVQQPVTIRGREYVLFAFNY